MRLLWLADAFAEAGLVVVEEPGWQNRGKDWTDLVGMMQHHTACCMPYPVHKLYPARPGQWRIRANFSVQPGPGNPNNTPAKIHVIAAGACNYSSGVGSRKVLQETRQNIAPIEDAGRRRLPNTTAGGNRHFINNETAHRGDGSPIPAPMLETIDIAWYIIAKELGLSDGLNIRKSQKISRCARKRPCNRFAIDQKDALTRTHDMYHVTETGVGMCTEEKNRDVTLDKIDAGRHPCHHGERLSWECLKFVFG